MFTEDHSKYYPVGSRGADFSQSSLFGSQLPITHRAPIDRAFFVNSDLTKLRRRRQRERQKNKQTMELVSKKQLCTCITLFFFFFCSLCIITTWNDQILSLLENGDGKAINSTISVRTRVRCPLFSSNPNSLFLSNWASWTNHEKKWKDAKSIFQRRFHGRRRWGRVGSRSVNSASGSVHYDVIWP